MNLRFVEAFYWAASLKSVTRASERLFLTQSAVSSRIAALEAELGVLLLDRRDKQFRLSVAGQRFLTHAQRLLELQREVKTEMGSGAQPMSLRIGAIESVLHSWLIPMVERLRAGYPALELELTVETSPVLVDQIARGSLDLIFAALPAAADGLRSRTLPPMEMIFVGNALHQRRQPYGLANLLELDLLTFQRGSQPHVALLDLFRKEKLEPRRVHTISSISAMTQLVERGFGVATLPLAAARRLPKSTGLAVLECEVTLAPLPVFATFRTDPTGTATEIVTDEVFGFVTRNAAPGSSKKSMR